MRFQLTWGLIRGFVLALAALSAVSPSSAQIDSHDPEFDKIPFDKWVSEDSPGPFRWTIDVSRAALSFHQRFVANAVIKVDGRDLDPRRTHGKFLFLVQITAADGKKYQGHHEIELENLDANIKAAFVEYTQGVFFLPGEYRLHAAILDGQTGEHGVRTTQFRIPAMNKDWLQDAWRDLPAVEFLGDKDSPDSWYLPKNTGRLQWPNSAARVSVLVNVAPPIQYSRRGQGGEMAVLLPALKAIEPAASTVELIDFARRKSAFTQSNPKNLDWPEFKSSLQKATEPSINVKALADKGRDAQFFLSRVRQALRDSDSAKAKVVVILSAPVAFESGEDKTPISTEGLSGVTVFYIRFYPPVRLRPRAMPLPGRAGGRSGLDGGPMRPPGIIFDELASLLKPLNPKVHDVENPEQLSKVLAEIQKALQK